MGNGSWGRVENDVPRCSRLIRHANRRGFAFGNMPTETVGQNYSIRIDSWRVRLDAQSEGLNIEATSLSPALLLAFGSGRAPLTLRKRQRAGSVAC
jgi:hypothetical protein